MTEYPYFEGLLSHSYINYTSTKSIRSLELTNKPISSTDSWKPVRFNSNDKWNVIESNKMACTFVCLLVLTTFVMASQARHNVWASPTLKVEFNDEDFGKDSGCYRLNTCIAEYKRYTYNHVVQNNSIGYYRKERKWILFDGIDDSLNACEAKREALDRAYSSKTDALDISSFFNDTWKSSSGTPLDLY